MGISICDLIKEFFELIKESNRKNMNTTLLVEALSIYFKNKKLTEKLEEPWK